MKTQSHGPKVENYGSRLLRRPLMNNNTYPPHDSRIDLLFDIKKKLKKDILDPHLEWHERVELNNVIHNLKLRIQWLRECETSSDVS
jgi:hypothetical protein